MLFSTAFHRKKSQSCDERPLPRIQKSAVLLLRKFSTTGSSSDPEAKSLFQKILAVSPDASIFCSPREIPASASHLQSGFYSLATKKMRVVRWLVGSESELSTV